jgi:hypothetical protein
MKNEARERDEQVMRMVTDRKARKLVANVIDEAAATRVCETATDEKHEATESRGSMQRNHTSSSQYVGFNSLFLGLR